LREFIELGNCLSFTKAAKKLFISQPALSNHMSELEKAIGVKLINRGRTVKLTSAGACFHSDACKIVKILDSSIKKCQSFERVGTRGSLTIKAPIGGSSTKKWFLGLMSEFRRNYPHIEVHIIDGINAHFSDELVSGRIDCGIVPRAFEDNSTFSMGDRVKVLLQSAEPLGAWMDMSNPLLKKAEQYGLRIGELAGLQYPLPSGAQFEEIQNSATEFFDQHGITPQFRFVLVDSFEEFLYSLDEADVLLGVASGKQGVSGALDSKVFVPFNPTLYHKTYVAVRVDNSNPALTLFREYLECQLAIQKEDFQAGGA